MSMVWMNCSRSPPLSLMLRRPRDDHRIARAAEVARDLLGPLERRVHRVRPRGREMIEVLRPAELVDGLDVVLPLLREAVEEHVLAQRAFEAAFGARAVVAGDVDDERVVGVGQLLARRRRCVRARGRSARRSPRTLPSCAHRGASDRRSASPTPAGLWSASVSFVSLRDDAELLLPRERLLAGRRPSRRRTCP